MRWYVLDIVLIMQYWETVCSSARIVYSVLGVGIAVCRFVGKRASPHKVVSLYP